MSKRGKNTPLPPSPDDHGRESSASFEAVKRRSDLSEGSALLDQRLGPFEVREVIGRGGMGVVYAGRHVQQLVPVAIKVITGADPTDSRLRRRLRNEVQAVAGLNHPGIVRVFDYGEVQRPVESLTDGELSRGTPYYVMELTRHGTLREVSGRLQWGQVKAILLTVLDALAHAHAAGVIHRDIKPENILLGRWSGRLIPKLADFGIACAVEGNTSSAHCVGTPRYMAPEQINQPWRTHGPWSDLYSLGCVAYELLSGRELFEGSDLVKIYQAHFRAAHPKLDPVVTVPPALQDWLDKMLRRDYKDRFQSAADAVRALVEIDDEGLTECLPPEPVEEEFVARTPVLEPLVTKLRSPEYRSKRAESPQQADPLPDHWPAPEVDPTPIQIVGAGLGLYGLRAIPLIGRDDELDQLWTTFRRAEQEEQSEVIVLQGPQGCGKTRLVDWFVQRLGEFGAATVLKGSHNSEGSGTGGLAMMLDRHFRTVGTDEREAENAIRMAMGEGTFDVPYEWQVMLRIVRPELDEGLEAVGIQIASPAQRYAVMRRYMRHLSEERPVVIWFDDVQWGNEAIEFARFVRNVQPDDTGPVMIVMSVTADNLAERPNEARMLEELVELDRVQQLDISPLEPFDQERLVEELLLLEGDLAREVVRRSSGNPLFAVELIGDWVQRGVLEVGERGFVLGEDVEPVIPDHLHDVWVQRIEALLEDFSRDARQALELAAALGQSVQAEEWRGVCDLEGVYLEESISAELIERRFAQSTEKGWAFSHPIVRESIERIARDAGRWITHRRTCATLVETLYDTSRPRVAERFGRYLMSAHEFGRALEPLLLATRTRRRRGEYHQAQHLLSDYLRCLELLGVGEDDRRWGEAWIIRSRIYLNDRQPREASRWAQKTLEAAALHGWDDLRAQACGRLGLAKQWLGESEAADYLREACELLGDISDHRTMHGIYGSVAHGLTRLGDFEDAMRLLDRDLDLATRRGDERDIAYNHYLRSRHAFFQSKWGDAIEAAEKGLALFSALGHLPGQRGCLEYLAEIHRLNGDIEKAENIYRRCLDMDAKIGSPAAIAQTNLANILLNRGRPGEAEKLFMMASTAFEAAGRRLFHAVAMAGRLACAAAQQLWGAVDDHLEPIQRFIEETEACEPDLAELLEVAGDQLRDDGQFRDAVAIYELVAEQWQCLDEPERVEAVMKKIERWT